MAALHRRHGDPPLWLRPPGYATLVRIILEQQVSLISARAVYVRLTSRLGRVTPASVIRAGIRGLRRIGLTRQKAAYCFNLALMTRDGGLDLRSLAMLSDEDARASLQTVHGIGPWTADIYLLMALGRPDIWPVGDLALLTALHRATGWRKRRDQAQAFAYARRWSPWRSVAARMLWNSYLQDSRSGR